MHEEAQTILNEYLKLFERSLSCFVVFLVIKVMLIPFLTRIQMQIYGRPDVPPFSLRNHQYHQSINVGTSIGSLVQEFLSQTEHHYFSTKIILNSERRILIQQQSITFVNYSSYIPSYLINFSLSNIDNLIIAKCKY